MMKKIFKSLILLLLPVSLSAQLIPVNDHYVLNPLVINPAYAGSRGALDIALFYRRQWIGIEGAPETKTIAIDAPFLDSKLGLGLLITGDKVGVTKETKFLTSYAYRINMGDGQLSFGLGAGITTTNTAWSDLVVLDPGDEYYLIDSRVYLVPDFNFGIYYSHKNFFSGLSVPRLMEYKFDFQRNRYSSSFNPGQYQYLFNTGYSFTTGSKLRFIPSTLISFSPGEKLLYDINSNLSINDRLWFGISYRNGRSVSALVQLAVSDQFRLAYTYDFDLGRLERYNNGSHEIMLRYEFRYKVKAINPLMF